ncbi:MAG: hypothetical protein GWO38_21975, partial [Phycisphaerae bacterium]|nr:hypothetical protein [Phycisphaerae bacterium]NIX30231.1 hypothetical protein [Phycisphaerae bacterium]
LTSLLSSIFYANHRFFMPSFAPILNSSALLGVTFFFHESLGIQSVALGFLVGSSIQTILLFVYLPNNKNLTLSF